MELSTPSAVARVCPAIFGEEGWDAVQDDSRSPMEYVLLRSLPRQLCPETQLLF